MKKDSDWMQKIYFGGNILNFSERKHFTIGEKLYILGGNKYWCFKNWQIWSMCVSAKISRLTANFCKKKVCRQSICWFFICWFFISFHNSPFHQTGILRHPTTSFVLITAPTIYDFPDFCSFLIVTTRVTWIYSLVRLVVPNTEELISRLFMGL